MKSLFIIWVGVHASCAVAGCLDFFYVKRPVAYGAVYHEYVAARNPKTGKSEAFGLLKGSEDLKIFLNAFERKSEATAVLRFMGNACDENAKRASDAARKYAKEWEVFYDNEILFYSRMGVTPVVGKPCRNVALEIAEILKKFLH
ncbi:MAG: hypothetical protein EBR01_09070 [Proteobacteria bacterium]|jgi:hypothetical protein|nr:hypothetical protein [Pseudomonadota bacterium]NBY20292.1 hypothetical protein [bacterium]